MSQVDEIVVRRVMQRFEHDIVSVNRERIGEIAGDITQQDLLKIGEVISICRARYLKSVLDMAKTDEQSMADRLTDEVKKNRLLYEESMAAFAALRLALERGYVEVSDC